MKNVHNGGGEVFLNLIIFFCCSLTAEILFYFQARLSLTADIGLLIYLKERSLLFTAVQGGFNSKPFIMNSLPTGPVEHVHLSVPFVAIRNKDVNITAVVWPSQAGTLTYFWWFGNSTKVQISFGSVLLPKLVTTVRELSCLVFNLSGKGCHYLNFNLCEFVSFCLVLFLGVITFSIWLLSALLRFEDHCYYQCSLAT